MTVGVKCGSFTKSGTSNTVTTTFKVKGLIVYNTTVGATAAGSYQGSGGVMVGISDGTNNIVNAITSTDGSASSDTFQTWNNFVAVTHSAPGTQQDTGVATFGASTDFTVNWTNGGTPQTPTFFYIAIGGDDITNAKVMHFNATSSDSGNFGYTGVGFQPDWAFTLSPFKTSTGNNLVYANSSWSSFMSTSRQWAMAFVDEDGSNTQDSWKYLRTDFCHLCLTNAGAVNSSADFVQWDSDGFTWNYTNPQNIGNVNGGLFIKGGIWDVGSFTKPTTTGAQDQVITLNDNTLNPRLVMLTSVAQVSHSAPVNQMSTVALGATDGTNEGAIWTGCGPDASDPMINASIKLDNKILRLATANTTHTSSTTNAECSIVTGGSMSTAGQFTLDWTTVDSTTAHEICYIVLGDSTTGQTFQRTPSDTITLSESTARPLVARTKSDTITLSESLNRVSTFQRTALDTRSISESLQIYGIRVRTASDTISLTETTTRPLIGRSASDTVNTSDTVARLATRVRTAQDTITVNDTVQKFLVLLRTLSDTVNLSESIQRVYTVLKSAQDTVSLSDSAARLAEFVRTPQDTVSLSDSVSKLVTLIKNLLDTIILSETVQKIKNPGEGTTFTRNVSDTIIIAEELLRSLTTIRTIQDTVTQSDTVQRILTAIRSVEDTITLTDTVQRLLTVIRTASDTINLSESLSRIYTALRTSSDTTILSDTVQRLFTALRTAQDTTILSESVSRILQALRQVQDSLGLAPPARFIYHHYFTDIVPLSESVEGIFIQGALLFDRFRSSFGGFGSR